ncbi:MAG: hypothetical protein COT71_01470 [Candidatus Andersenbacteria bacterium CG10_big_fil_rev_8_21_14_0_10_54_11]|uniref:PPM-type phosphatase domain-containing protein n=1 Tax=Candidatus Andersenbacteria bacterium CG10_big_fil_rev_8_21_14_0_10_54_11 TaxID=1974485 RepID=A0A2M6WZV8_9BACT|nr:MAG: hypothetical protein COT71_01470 [Candidatus Andersenbacteria bacterium CG10_big_fil_rev_8_21_14_0_10_54_11]
MSSRALGTTVRVDADEVVLFDGSGSVGDTFIFEPAAVEQNLGSLFAVAETEDRAGVGRELLETVIQALQREYYRDPTRPLLPSFESALHQANLVLYDLAEQGVRDWMGSFHVAAGVLAGTSLHVSTAGEASVLLARGQKVTSITTGLSHSPVTDPLRTFSQVASGVLAGRDVLFFATSNFDAIYRPGDLTRLTVDGSAATAALRLRQLYEDRSARLPVAALIVSLVPKYVAADERPAGGPQTENAAAQPTGRRAPVLAYANLGPRKPIIIHRSVMARTGLLLTAVVRWLRHHAAATVWPRLVSGGRRSGQALRSATISAGRHAQSGLQRWRGGRRPAVEQQPMAAPVPPLTAVPLRRFTLQPRRAGVRIWLAARDLFRRLPRTSKVLAVVALLLAFALLGSLVLLQRKRTADQQIQHVSELLHDAQTKQEAAATALIYDNREQARALLQDAQALTDEATASHVYEEQVAALRRDIADAQDRLAKVTRVAAGAARLVGDFATVLPRGGLTDLLYLQGALYTFDPQSNAIAVLALPASPGGEASAAKLANQTTSGIGFFVSGVSQEADKALVLQSDEPGLAVYDVKSDLLQKQEISWPTEAPDIAALAVFGNRLYVYNRAVGDIYSYTKTLRGYAGGERWLESPDPAAATVTGMGIDGFIYTLHRDGTIQKFFKGAPVDFALEPVEPPLSENTALLITEELGRIYLLDRTNKRVVIFETNGALVRQLALPEETQPQAIAVDPAETTMYVLDGTQVLAVPLE